MNAGLVNKKTVEKKKKSPFPTCPLYSCPAPGKNALNTDATSGERATEFVWTSAFCP